MPADGKMSQIGRIEQGRIFQAKGQSFTAAELLGDEAAALPLRGRLVRQHLSVAARLPPRAHALGRHPDRNPARARPSVQRGALGRARGAAPVRPQRTPGLPFRNRLRADVHGDGWRAAGVRSGDGLERREYSRLCIAALAPGFSRPADPTRPLRRDGAIQLRVDRDHAVPQERNQRSTRYPPRPRQGSGNEWEPELGG